MSYDDFRQKIKQRLEISKLIKKNVDLKNVTVTEQEVNDYIEQYKSEFSDFFEHTDKLELLKLKIKAKLLENKRAELVMKYADSLK